MDLEVKVVGFKELAAALRELPENISKNILRSAVAAGAAEIRMEAKSNALRIKRSGTLARAIYQKQIQELSDQEKQTFFVGARHGKRYQHRGKKGLSADAYYAPFVEFGHFTRQPGSAKRLRKTNRGEVANPLLAFQVRTGQVKWVPPNPFLRPAFDTKKEAAVEAIAKKLADRILQYKAKK